MYIFLQTSDMRENDSKIRILETLKCIYTKKCKQRSVHNFSTLPTGFNQQVGSNHEL